MVVTAASLCRAAAVTTACQEEYKAKNAPGGKAWPAARAPARHWWAELTSKVA